jgi:hypothetical protein
MDLLAKDNYFGLTETCAVFGKDLKENEPTGIYSFSLNKGDSLKKNPKEICSYITAPKGITGELLCSLFPKERLKLFFWEVEDFKKEVMEPGCYIVKNQPVHTWSKLKPGGGPKNPKLIEIMYVYVLHDLLSKILKRKLLLADDMAVLCDDKITRMGREMPVQFKVTGGIVEIAPWKNEIPLTSVFSMNKCM